MECEMNCAMRISLLHLVYECMHIFSHILVQFLYSFVSGCYKVSDYKMANVRSFYGKKTQHCEITTAVNQVEEEKL